MKTFFKFLIKTITFFTLLIVPISYEDQLGENFWIIYALILIGLALWIGRGILILVYKGKHEKPPTTDALIHMAKKPLIFFGLFAVAIYILVMADFSPTFVLLGLVIILGLVIWFLRGLWRLFLEPTSEKSWGWSPSDAGEREEWLKEKIRDLKFKRKQHKNNSNKKIKIQAKIDRYKTELDHIKEEYWEAIAEYKSEKDYKKTVRKVTKEYNEFGLHAPKVICPHCSEKGNVWRNENATREERSQEAGFVGAVIGRKTVTKKQVTQMHCKNCSTSWVV